MDEPTIRRRNRLNKHYTTVSNVIIFGYDGLTDAEKLTYQAVDSFDWSDGEGLRKGYAYPSLRTLARLRGLDERTLRRHLAVLESVGLLRREQRPGQPNLLWIEEPSEGESEKYLSTIAMSPDTDARATPDTDVRPLYEESQQSETDKTVNGAESLKGRRGRERFLSAAVCEKVAWLAQHMSTELRDEASLVYYRELAQKFSEQRIFEALSQVRTLQREGKIRSSAARAFVWLLRRA